MEKAYSTITKVLIVCIVATIVCTIFRVKSLDVIIDATDELGNNIESIRESDEDGEIGDVEGYAILFNGLAMGAGFFATAALWIVIVGIGFVTIIIFTGAIIFMQICKALETSTDPEKWKLVTSKILFIIYAITHALIALFDVLFINFFTIDAIVVILALVANLYLYVKGRKEDKVVDATSENINEPKIEVIDENKEGKK